MCLICAYHVRHRYVELFLSHVVVVVVVVVLPVSSFCTQQELQNHFVIKC